MLVSSWAIPDQDRSHKKLLFAYEPPKKERIVSTLLLPLCESFLRLVLQAPTDPNRYAIPEPY